jgi:hypothetical protein
MTTQEALLARMTEAKDLVEWCYVVTCSQWVQTWLRLASIQHAEVCTKGCGAFEIRQLAEDGVKRVLNDPKNEHTICLRRVATVGELSRALGKLIDKVVHDAVETIETKYRASLETTGGLGLVGEAPESTDTSFHKVYPHPKKSVASKLRRVLSYVASLFC